MLRYLLLVSILSFSYFAHSSIYQTCKWSDQPLTDRFIQFNQEFLDEDTPLEDYQSCTKVAYNQYNELQPVTDVLNTEEPFLTGPIPSICFLSSSARGTSNRPSSKSSSSKYYHCNSPNNTNPNDRMAVKNPNTGQTHHLYLRSPCISEDYHSSLVKTFNKMVHCFGLSQREARNLFAIINHESQFIPNAQSSTGARCAGQLTRPAITTLNAHILENYFPGSHIYQSAVSRCPSLIDKTIPSDILCTKTESCPHSHLQTGSQASKELKLSKYPITCKLTSDLPLCFFYTFLYFKETLINFDQKFQAPNEFDSQEIPDRFIQKYGVGLNPNEIIIAKKADNSNDAHLFITAQSAYEEVQKHENQSNNPMYNLNVETVSLISPEDMKYFKFYTTQISYNGGRSVMDSQVTNFLTFLKEQIDQADCSAPNNKYCKYRRHILEGNALNLDSIKEDFKAYLRVAKNAKGKLMYSRDETFVYPDKIQESIDHFQNSNGLVRKNLQTVATKHINTDKVSPEVGQQIRNTVDDIKNQCNIPIL